MTNSGQPDEKDEPFDRSLKSRKAIAVKEKIMNLAHSEDVCYNQFIKMNIFQP